MWGMVPVATDTHCPNCGSKQYDAKKYGCDHCGYKKPIDKVITDEATLVECSECGCCYLDVCPSHGDRFLSKWKSKP